MKNYFLSVQNVHIYLAQFVQFQKISTMYTTPTEGIRISRVLRGSVRSKKFKERIFKGFEKTYIHITCIHPWMYIYTDTVV